MNKSNFLFLIIIICLSNIYKCLAGNNIVCYYTNWAQYRNGDAKYFPEDIDPYLCTHIIFSFAKLVNGELAPYEWNDESTEWSKGMYERTIDLKKINPNLKVLIAVGGWNMGSTDFSNMVNNVNARVNFVKTSVLFLKKHKFDGLDLDWEYPSNFQGSRPTDKALFTKLVSELKLALKAENLLLTAAVAAGKSTIDTAYEIANIAADLDFINLMTYDLHGSWEDFTGHHSALYARNAETDPKQRTLNVDFAVNYWISNGTPKGKINLGLATYGRSFKLSDPNKNGLGAPASGPGSAGTYTREAGFISYYEVCEKINQGWTRKFDNEHLVPYLYGGSDWVGYEDIESLTKKANYIKTNGLGGAMFWALDLDDFTGKFCNMGKYPLMNSVKSIINGNTGGGSTSFVSTTTTTKSPNTGITTQNVQTTTLSINSNEKCYKGNGYYPDLATGCQQYYVCLFFGTTFQSIQYFTCPASTIFDSTLGACNHASTTVCKQ